MKSKINHIIIKKLKYCKVIYDYEENIKNIHLKPLKRNENYKYKGYLINLNEYEKFKESIDYNNKININHRLNDINLSNFEKIYTIKGIELKTSQYLINMLYNENEYIIVDENFWKIICENGKENEEPILYNIKYNKLSFTLDNNIEFIFNQDNNNENIINKKLLYSKNKYKSNINEIDLIYKDIINYFNY